MAERTASSDARGYFGLGIYQTNSELNTGTLFRAAHAFGAQFAFTIGKRFRRDKFDTSRFTRHVPLFHYTDFEDFLRHRPLQARLIAVELTQDAMDLARFYHPEQAIYLLGAEDDGLPPEILGRCDQVICLDTPFSLNVATTGSIVLYDRQTKHRALRNRKAMFRRDGQS